jgi:hypothetical protein
MNFNIDEMSAKELKELVKVLVENVSHLNDLIYHLQNRVLKLEMSLYVNDEGKI